MISHKHKFIFIHINCCGGTSIESALSNYGHMKPGFCDPEKLEWIGSPFSKNASQHLTGLEFYKSYGEEVWNTYYKFAFVRNPFSRMVGYFAKRGIRLPQFKNNFKKFILNIDTDVGIRARMKKPCFHWISDENDNSLLDLNFIGKLENFQLDFDNVCDNITIPRQRLPRKGKSKHKHYTEYYDDETRQIVEERYAKDIEHFGYKFGE